jgi:hypothetical protein
VATTKGPESLLDIDRLDADGIHSMVEEGRKFADHQFLDEECASILNEHLEVVSLTIPRLINENRNEAGRQYVAKKGGRAKMRRSGGSLAARAATNSLSANRLVSSARNTGT